MKFVWMRKVVKYLASAAILSTLVMGNIQSATAQDEINETLQYYAYGKGELIEGIKKLENILATTQERDKALFAIGMLDFLKTLQNLQRDLYRYGAGTNPVDYPFKEVMANSKDSHFVPFFRIPVPYNSKPEQINYENAREILEIAVAGFETAQASLAEVKPGDFKLELDLLKIAFDINEDGKIEVSERLVSVFDTLVFKDRALPQADLTIGEKIIRFDSADVSWLQGYCNALAGVGKFFLAFDFTTTYEASFHIIFGEQATDYGRKLHLGKGTPEQIKLAKEEIVILEEEQIKAFPAEKDERFSELSALRNKIYLDKLLSPSEREQKFAEYDEKHGAELEALEKLRAQSFLFVYEIRKANDRLAKLDPSVLGAGEWSDILDFAGFIHSINWPLDNPDMLKQSREHFIKVMQLNYQTWDLVQKETDDDHEWLPNANQTSPFSQMEVTQALIDEWLATVKRAQRVLDGELLIPSMRFGKGINLKMFFETANHFDLVLFITGQGSVDYVQEGPIVNESLMGASVSPFGGEFSMFAIWFN